MPELEEETALANIALDLLGQARMLLARAGTILGRTEDELAFFRDEHEFRNVRLVERARRRLRRARRPAAGLRHLAAGAVRAAARARRPGARRDRRQGRQGADLPPRLRRAVGRAARRRHRAVAAADAGRARRRLAAGRRAVRAHAGSTGAERDAREVDVVLDTVLATAGLDRPDVGAARRRSAAGPGATACTPRRWATSWPSCRASPARTRTRHGEHRLATSRPPCPTRSCRWSPSPTSASCARSTRTARRSPSRSRPTYSGCPAMREISADLRHRLQRRGLRRRHRPHRARAGVEQRLDHRRTGGASSPRPASRRRPAPARRRGPIPLTPDRAARRSPARAAAAPTREQTAAFSGTACKALLPLPSCAEPFEHIKAI